MEKMKSFAACMERLARRNSISNVFSDFLEMAVCALSMGAMEQRYLEIVKRYEKGEAQLMAEAFGAMVMEMDDHGQGLKDVFGDFFMEHISGGHNGQFFTPEEICELMARMTLGMEGEEEEEGVPKQVRHDGQRTRPLRIADCAVGSGRTLMAAEKVMRSRTKFGLTARYYGADVDRTCAMMCVINFCLNGMLGEVAWMDSLSNRFFGAWAIRIHPVGRVPYVVPLKEEESEIVLRMEEGLKEEQKEVNVFKEVKDDFFDELLNSGTDKKVKQLSLF